MTEQLEHFPSAVLRLFTIISDDAVTSRFWNIGFDGPQLTARTLHLQWLQIFQEISRVPAFI